MDSFEQWKSWFHDWPEQMPRQGVVATVVGDQIPFSGFLVGDTMVLLQRRAPDSLGARQVLLPYQRIDSVKITDVVDQKIFRAAGFQGKLSKR
jgi:hypothetical protein